MISAGLEGRLSYMTYPEPWGGPPKHPPEFLRPAPKPLSQASKYNGVPLNTAPNGARLVSSQRSISGKYPPSSSATSSTPVNLTSPSAHHKDNQVDDLAYSPYARLFPPPHTFAHYPTHYSIYQSPYTPLIRPNFAPPPPLSPLEAPPYTPTNPSASATTGATFLSPSATFSPPALSQSNSVVVTSSVDKRPSPGFKVPSGKEGSLKHRILTRPGDVPKGVTNLHKSIVAGVDTTPTSCYHQVSVTPQQLPSVLSDVPTSHSRKRLVSVLSPPNSPATSSKPSVVTIHNNNVIPSKNFVKGALIQLASGELRRIEDMQTDDFIQSAEQSTELRLAESTVVRMEEALNAGTVTITLTYNQRRTQVEFESRLEHPFFVYGRGWASFAPERTLQVFGLKVHRLQVGDVLISLTPREPNSSSTSSIITTTATTTTPTPRQTQQQSSNNSHLLQQQQQQQQLHHQHHQQQLQHHHHHHHQHHQSPNVSGHQPIYTTQNYTINTSSSNSNLLNLVMNNSNSANNNNNNNNNIDNNMNSNNVRTNVSNSNSNNNNNNNLLSGSSSSSYIVSNHQRQINSHSQPNQTVISDTNESDASKKRRWSAPDEICDDDEQTSNNKKVKSQ